MATTEHFYTGNNSTTSFAFTFPYLANSDVKVELDNVLKTENSSGQTNNDYTINNTNIVFNSAPGTGVAIHIYRTTNVDTAQAQYAAGSSIRAADLNNNQTQLLYSAQEAGQLIRQTDLKDSIVNSAKIVDGSIATGDLADGLITTAKLANDSVTNAKIVAGSVGTRELNTSGVTTAKIADSNVTTSKIADSNVTTAKIADSNVTTAKIAADAITGAKIADDQINSEHYVDGSIDTAHIANSQVTTSKIADDAVNGSKIADNSIDSEHYVDGSIDTAHIADSQITSAKIADGTIVAGDLASNSVTTAKITDANVTTSKIAADAITGAKIADDQINSEHYVDGSIDTAHIGGAQVTTAKLASNSVTTSKITDANVTTAKVADANITLAKLASDLKQTSISDTDTQLPTSGAVVDYVAAQLEPFGGFEAVATEVAFPNTQPVSGVAISISDAGGVVINGSGVSTTGRTVGGSTVTINGFPSSLYNETLVAGIGLIVTSTGSSQTYNYHKILGKEGDIKQLSDDINDFNARYRVGSSNPTSALDSGDLFFNTGTGKLLVYNGTASAWEEAQSIGQYFINTISSYSGTGGNSATFNGSAYRFVLSNAGAVAEQHIVSINGVVQKPNSGTSQPSEGFAIDGSSIIFSSAPPTGSDFFIITIGSTVNIGTPSNGTVTTDKLTSGAVTTVKIADNAVTGAKIADNLDIPDNNKIRFGTGNDLQIYHDGLDSYIRDMGTGELWIDSNGASVNIINDGSLANGKMARFFKDGAVELYYDNVKKFETTSSGVAIGSAVTINSSSNVMDLVDNFALRLGNSQDFAIYHDGSNSIIDNNTGDLVIRGDGDDVKILAEDGIVLRDNDDSTNFINCINGGAVELYHNGSKKLQTYAGGVEVIGALYLQSSGSGSYFNDNVTAHFGNSQDLKIYHTGSGSRIENLTGTFSISNAANEIQVNKNSSEYMARFITDGAVELYHNNIKKFETTSTGATVTGSLVTTYPTSNRNMLLNGNMRVAQRLDGDDGGSYDLSGGNYRGVDLAMVRSANSSTLNVSHPVHDSLRGIGLQQSLKVISNSVTSSLASTAYSTVVLHLEGEHIIPTAWGYSGAKPCTLSFYVRSNVTGTFTGSFGNSGNNRGNAFEYTINNADTWERKTITVSGDTTGTWDKTQGLGMKITFSLGHGSSFNGTAGSWTASEVMGTSNQTMGLLQTTGKYWEISGAQFELGSVATSVERQEFGPTLMKCKRYYYQSRDYGSNLHATNNWNSPEATMNQSKHTRYYDTQYFHPVEMRANPTMTFFGTAGTANSGVRVEEPGVRNDEITSGSSKNPNTVVTSDTGFLVRYILQDADVPSTSYTTGSGNAFMRLTFNASAEF